MATPSVSYVVSSSVNARPITRGTPVVVKKSGVTRMTSSRSVAPGSPTIAVPSRKAARAENAGKWPRRS